MANTAIWFGLALILLGVGGYAATGGQSPTALIPAAFGLLLALAGFLGRDPAKRKLMMHIAATVALLGFLGSVQGLLKLPALLGSEPLERPAAVMAQSVMGILCLVFTVLCVRSFINARRSRA
jgi:lysylphosphatidylglycerol synthetase-like protein (DUF2156 family)